MKLKIGLLTLCVILFSLNLREEIGYVKGNKNQIRTAWFVTLPGFENYGSSHKFNWWTSYRISAWQNDGPGDYGIYEHIHWIDSARK